MHLVARVAQNNQTTDLVVTALTVQMADLQDIADAEAQVRAGGLIAPTRRSRGEESCFDVASVLRRQIVLRPENGIFEW